MSRRARRLFALCLAVPLSLLLVAAVAVWFWGPSVRTSVERGQKHFQPVLDGLGRYYEKHGEYPRALTELVAEGLVTSIPSTPPVGNARAGEPEYEVADDRQSFTFGFSYHLKRQLFLGDTTYAEWSSRDGKWRISGPGY